MRIRMEGLRPNHNVNKMIDLILIPVLLKIELRYQYFNPDFKLIRKIFVGKYNFIIHCELAVSNSKVKRPSDSLRRLSCHYLVLKLQH